MNIRGRFTRMRNRMYDKLDLEYTGVAQIMWECEEIREKTDLIE